MPDDVLYLSTRSAVFDLRACLADILSCRPGRVYGSGAACPLSGLCLRSHRAAVAAFQAVSPLRVQLFLWFNAVTPYFFPLSYIGLGLLALRRSPVLATAGIVLGLLGSQPFGFFV